MSNFGREFESKFSKLLGVGAKIQPGSGNGWMAKLDVRGKSILWSCKARRPGAQSMTFSRYDFKEAEDATSGPNGTGDLPGMAFELDGEVYLMMKAGDFLTLMASDVTIDGSKAAKKRRSASVPAALRD